MYIFWHRAGFLVVVLFLVAFVGMQLALDKLYGAGFYEATGWAKAAGGLAAAVLIGGIGFLLNRKLPWEKQHRFFFIPMEYWAAIILIAEAVVWARQAFAG